MLTINTNINNLKLQRNLNTVNSGMQQALSRLSTGYRINNASDDAAGLVISTALNVQSRGLNIANQNAQMATNILGVADSALSKISDLTMRIRDLATQAANGGYSITERNSLQMEAKELSLSLEQIVQGTKFNEFNIFNSTASKGIITEEEASTQGYTIIKTANELQNIKNNLSGKYILMNNIDLSSISNWDAIGTNTGNFTGTFDGNGFTISNLKINKTADYQGLFGYTSNAVIKNVTLTNVDVKGGNYTGGLAGYVNGSTNISNCSASGNVAGTSNTGGLVGSLDDTGTSIFSSYATCSVAGTVGEIGGLVGFTKGAISNSYATGSVTGKHSVGGFAGTLYYQGRTINSWASGDVYSLSTSDSNSSFGGFAGCTNGSLTITNCYSTGQNLATVGYRGGFIGAAYTSGISSSGNSFIAQTGGFASLGTGTIPSNITQQSSSYFTPALVQSTLETGAGAGQWDFSGSIPRLKWQVPPPNILTFQIETEGSKLSTITVDTGFSLGGFSIDFSTADSARAAMIKCDELLKQINTKRGEIGASSNIVRSIINGNTITNENLSASKSRIQDADIAKESANMVKNQILENATTVLLAQSQTFDGQIVLQLLGELK